MLSQLKKIEPAKIELTQKSSLDERGRKLAEFIFDKHPIQSETLFQQYLLQKNEREYNVIARGILEDFKITLDGRVVLAYSYDNVYQCNSELIDLILD